MKIIKSAIHGHMLTAECEYCGFLKQLLNKKPQDIRLKSCPECGKISKPIDKKPEWVGYR